MRTVLRKDYPYYGVYPYKVIMRIFLNSAEVRTFYEFLGQNFKSSDIKFTVTWWNLFLKNKKDVDFLLQSQYGNDAIVLYEPAPGYENLSGKRPEDGTLWYGRFPYRIKIKSDEQADILEADKWCIENTISEYTRKGISGRVSYYFISGIDAMSFKIMYSNLIAISDEIEDNIAIKILKNRMERARQDLMDYLESKNIVLEGEVDD